MTDDLRSRFYPGRLEGYFLRAWRKHRKLTIEQMAERTGLSVAAISQMERGKQGFSVASLEKIAEALDCEPGDLLRHHPLCPIYRLSRRLADLPKDKQRMAERMLDAMEDDT